jgi:energy-converting hydrogenase Eha subunit F
MPIYKENRANPNAIYFEESSLGWVYFEDKLVWQKEAISPEFIFTVSLTEETQITLPLLNGYTYDFTIDWGDGSSIGTVTSYNDADATHTFMAGTYDITINGICQCFRTATFSIYDQLDESIGNIAPYITEIKQWGICDFLSLSFSVCDYLSSIPNGKITGADNVTDIRGLFMTTSITSIPDGLLDLCIKVNNATGVFASYSISSIPAGLFDNNPLITSFKDTFLSSSIQSIPAGLFDNCTLSVRFDTCFLECKSLTSIPAGLFDNCTLATDFTQCFMSCESLSGNAPELWLRVPEPNGLFCFAECTGLDNYAEIPSDWK